MVTLGLNDSAQFLRTMDSKPANFFQAHVKRLCLTIHVKPQTAARILSVCTGVHSLACWVDFRSSNLFAVFPSLITALPLRRLSIDVGHLIGLLGSQPIWLSSLTHLDVIFWASIEDSGSIIPGLDSLLILTHLAFNVELQRISATSLSTIISACPHLEVLVIIVDEDAEDVEGADESVLDDPRIVYLPYPNAVPDWEAPVRGQPDIWSRAQEIVRIQRTRKGQTSQ